MCFGRKESPVNIAQFRMEILVVDVRVQALGNGQEIHQVLSRHCHRKQPHQHGLQRQGRDAQQVLAGLGCRLAGIIGGAEAQRKNALRFKPAQAGLDGSQRLGRQTGPQAAGDIPDGFLSRHRWEIGLLSIQGP